MRVRLRGARSCLKIVCEEGAELPDYLFVNFTGRTFVRFDDDIRTLLELNRRRPIKGRGAKGTRGPIRAASFALLETLLTVEQQMHVDDLAAVRMQQRSETVTHAGRIQDDAATVFQCALEAAVQFGEYPIAAAPLRV